MALLAGEMDVVWPLGNALPCRVELPGARPVGAVIERERAGLEHDHDGGSVVPGLAEVLALFPERVVDGWTLAGWLRTEDPELGAVPFETLTQGKREMVSTVARAASASLSA